MIFIVSLVGDVNLHGIYYELRVQDSYLAIILLAACVPLCSILSESACLQ